MDACEFDAAASLCREMGLTTLFGQSLPFRQVNLL